VVNFGALLRLLMLYAMALAWITGKAQWALKDGKEHPLKVVGHVAGAIVFLVFVGWQLASSTFLPTAG
jgi:hypothetical protein